MRLSEIPEDLRTDYAELKQEAHELSCDERDSSYPRWIMRLIERIAALTAENARLEFETAWKERNELLAHYTTAERDALAEENARLKEREAGYDQTSQSLHDTGLELVEWKRKYYEIERAHSRTVDKLSDAIARIQLREKDLAERGAQKSAAEQERDALKAETVRLANSVVDAVKKYCERGDEIGALKAQVERLSAVLEQIVRDFETDFVLDGVVVDEPYHTHRVAWVMASSALAARAKQKEQE